MIKCHYFIIFCVHARELAIASLDVHIQREVLEWGAGSNQTPLAFTGPVSRSQKLC
jgi:hypothetical protein